jgi:MFS family permease
MRAEAAGRPRMFSGGLAPLRHRSFALFWTGALVSNIGNWMETVAAGILVTESTHRAGWTAVVAVAGFLPAALLGPFGGALADRVERKRLLITANLLELILAAMLAFLASRGAPAPPILALILFAAGCVGALGFPAYQAILPDLVPHEDLLGAIALSSAQWNLGRVIGPALAGAAIYAGGYAGAFAINTLTFLAPIGALLLIHLPPPPPKTNEAILRRIGEGARFARHDPGVRAALLGVALFSLLGGPFIALVAAMAITVLHAGPGGAAVLVTGQGLGAVTAAFFLSGLAGRFGRGPALLGTMALLPPALIFYALSPYIWVTVPAIAILGGLYLSLLSGLSTVIQLRTPASLRGRVLSLQSAALSTLYLLGSICQGTIADHVGLRPTTIGAALLLMAMLAVAGRRGWQAGLVSVNGGQT